jgi:hypothetical protein
MASRRTGPLTGWVLAAAASVALGACLFGAEDTPGPCAAAGCDDGNPCTDDLCAEDGYCDHAPSTALPSDDNDCTDDVCEGVTAVHTARVDGAACGNAGLLQCASGVCTCSAAEQCGTSNVCVAYDCVDSACTQTNAAAGTAVDGAGDKDCKKNECDGAGAVVAVADTADPPDDTTFGDCQRPACSDQGDVIQAPNDADIPGDTDGNACTAEGCSGGAPTSGLADDGTVCGGPSCGAADGGGFAAASPPTCQTGVCTAGGSTPCGNYGCDDQGACGTFCFWSGQCASSAFCTFDGNCAPDFAGGQPCGDGDQCQSDTCAWENVCCDAECDTKCWSCKGSLNGGTEGVCKPIVSGQDPYNECGGSCNGQGACGS